MPLYRLINDRKMSDPLECKNKQEAWEALRKLWPDQFAILQEYQRKVIRIIDPKNYYLVVNNGVGSNPFYEDYDYVSVCCGLTNSKYDILLDERGYNEFDCPDSPDGKCHYGTDDDGKVYLYSTASFVDAPEGHDKEDEDYETCIYCGNPEERK